MATYNITNSIPNVTSGNKSITIVSDEGYALPSSITVTNGTLVSYDSSTGVAIVSGDNAIVSAECQSAVVSYLTFSSPSTFTLNVVDNKKYWDGTLQYSIDTITWNTWNGTTTLSSSSGGMTKYLYLRGSSNTYITGINASTVAGKWVLTGSNISCIGNIENLLDYTTAVSGNHPPMADYCYYHLFCDCTSLTSAPTLPATTLVTGCYAYMFQNCASLTSAPALPATTLSHSCYYHMFCNCTALITAPDELPATILSNYCCYYMFYGCTSLTSAPALPATTLTENCCAYMFYGCTSLTSAPALPATTLRNSCYYYMFYGCTSLTTPAIMGNGTTQVTPAKNCCYFMYYNCTALNIYTTSTNHTPFYKSITYSTTSSATNYRSSYRMFYNCKLNGSTTRTNYFTGGTQYYY